MVCVLAGRLQSVDRTGKDGGQVRSWGSKIHVPPLEVGGCLYSSLMSPFSEKEAGVVPSRLQKVGRAECGQIGEGGILNSSGNRLWQV